MAYSNPHTGTGSYWIVTQKDGTRMWYGSTSDSRIDAVGFGGKTLIWALSKVQDTNGNYFTVQYSEDTSYGDFYPSKITYTKNSAHSSMKTHTVDFAYEGRTDKYRRYVPSYVLMDHRLKEIRIKTNGNKVRKYRMDYGYSGPTKRSLLTKVQEYGSDYEDNNTNGSKLPPTTFSWQGGGEAVIQGTDDHRTNHQDGRDVYPGDYNGDGMTDLMFWKKDIGYAVIYPVKNGVIQGYSSKKENFHMHYDIIRTGDFDGDGIADLLFWDREPGELHIHPVKNGVIQSASYSANSFHEGYDDIITGDFNGDGMTDLFFWKRHAGDLFIHKVINGVVQGSSTHKTSFHEGSYVKSMDCNEDGVSDIIFWHQSLGDLHIHPVYNGVLQNAGYTRLSFHETSDVMIPTYSPQNGANYIIFWRRASGDLHIHQISQGKIVETTDSRTSYHEGYDLVTPGDYNGDGALDLIFWKQSSGEMLIHPIIGGVIQPDTEYRNSFHEGYDGNFPADFNGDGIMDLFFWKKTAGDLYIHRTATKQPDLLTKIVTPLGGDYRVTYKPAPQVSGAVRPDLNAYPKIADSSPRPIVTKLVADSHTDADVVANYTYSNGRFHAGTKPDRETLGFEVIRKTDNATGHYVRTIYHQNKPYHGLVDYQTSYNSSGELYNKSDYSWGSTTSGLPSGCTFVYKTDEYNYTYDGDSDYVRARKQFWYENTYGNVTKIKDHGQDDPSLSKDESEVYTEYCVNSSDWIVDKPKRSYIKGYNANAGSSMVIQQDTNYYYDDENHGTVTKGNLTKEVMENGSNDVELQHWYDSYGNRTKTCNGRGYDTIVAYDGNFHLYVTSTTDAKPYTSYNYYDNRMRLTQTKDINGVSSYISYDDFGRWVKKWTTPDDSDYPTKEIEYHNPGGSYGDYYTTVERQRTNAGESGNIPVVTFYDDLGRVIQTKTSAASGHPITQDTYYNASGHAYRKSMPYQQSGWSFSSRDSNQKYTQTYFDAIGRSTKVVKPDGCETRIGYYDNKINYYDENNHVRQHEIDGQGNIIKVREYTGSSSYTLYATTTYQYNTGTGQLAKTIDQDGNETVMYYDLLGQKTRMDDSDMGTWYYWYDKNGNLTRQQDAKGQDIYTHFDELDRITKIDYPAGTDTIYSYDEAEGSYKNKGRLTKTAYAAGFEEFDYDVRGRVSKHKVKIDTLTKEETFTYDSANRVITNTLPDGEVLTYYYNAIGAYKVKGTGNYEYVSSVSFNTRNDITSMAYGNGKTVNYYYYDTATDTDPSAGDSTYSYRLRRIFSSDIYDVSYEYDKAGNVKKKTDAITSGYSEMFGYDDNDRLTSADGHYGNKSYSYNQIGNITSKDGQTYSYNSIPHAVTAKGSDSFAYDSNGNMTTARGKTLAYNYNNMMTSFTGGHSYAYFGKRRVKKVENGTTTRYFFPNYEEEDDGTLNVVKSYFINGKKVAQRSTDDGLMFYHKDHLESSARITKSNGDLAKKIGYTPYGMDDYESDHNGSAYKVKYRFNGKEKDATGLYYYGARYYDPDLGRFTTPDTIVQDPYDPQTLNRYSYCRNNPVKYIDPSGHYFVVGMIVGAVVGGITGGFKGMLLGALTGGIGGAVSGAVSAAVGGGLGGAIAGGAASGLVTGAINTAFNGGNLLTNMALGALTGAVSSGVSHSVRTAVAGAVHSSGGSCFTQAFAGNVIGSAAGGAASGLVRAAITGQPIGNAMAMGALHGAASGTVTTLVQASLGRVCFTAGTKIATKDGFKPIEEVKAGDLVLSCDENTGEKGYKRVKQTFIRKTQKVIKITLANGEVIETTKEHPFRVVEETPVHLTSLSPGKPDQQRGKWIAAGYIKQSNKLINSTGQWLDISEIKIDLKESSVYNFEVADWNTYFVSECRIFVHNYPGPVNDKGDENNKKRDVGILAAGAVGIGTLVGFATGGPAGALAVLGVAGKGALIGSGTNALFNVGDQLISNGGDIQNLDAGKVGDSALFGALFGSMGGSLAKAAGLIVGPAVGAVQRGAELFTAFYSGQLITKSMGVSGQAYGESTAASVAITAAVGLVGGPTTVQGQLTGSALGNLKNYYFLTRGKD